MREGGSQVAKQKKIKQPTRKGLTGIKKTKRKIYEEERQEAEGSNDAAKEEEKEAAEGERKGVILGENAKLPFFLLSSSPCQFLPHLSIPL